jgi:DNA-binding transcriptional regulator YiaG
VKATNPSGVEGTSLAGLRAAGLKTVYGQPTAEEISRLTFAKLRDIRIHTQELRNRFARLLNRGSSLE